MSDVSVTTHFLSGEVSALAQYYDRRPFYRRLFAGLTLQAKLLVASVMLIAVILASYCAAVIQLQREQTLKDIKSAASQASASLAATTPHLISAADNERLAAAAQSVLRASDGLLFVSFFDAQGNPILGRKRDGVATPLPMKPSKLNGLAETIDATWGAYVSAAVPVPGAHGEPIAYVRVGFSTAAVEHRTDEMMLLAAKLALAFTVFSIPVAWVAVRRVFRPFRKFVDTLKKISIDDMNSALETRRKDVIGDLSAAFNEMRLAMRRQQEMLKQANQKLAETNHDLENRIEQRTAQFETANRRLTMEIAEKEDFLRAVSHDLNAPLRNIAGMVTMLLIKKKGQLDEDLLHRLDRIKKNVEIETDLINELLELSRIKTRRQAMENVELESLLWDLRGMFENDLKTRDIGLMIDTQMPTLFGERARLRQIFQNLIDNAIKYMGDGRPREIHVGCTLRLSEAEFYVRDTGVGIDSEDVGKVFFIFRRGKNTLTPNVPGKGVGLASVKSIIETYNGKIWVESELGKGTTFRFTINGQFVPATGGTVTLAKGAAVETTGAPPVDVPRLAA